MGKELANRKEMLAERTKMQQFRFVLLLIQTDLPPSELAQKLAKGDPLVAARWRKRYQRWKTDPDFANLLAAQVNGELALALPRMGNALIRRASKGNVPAIKLAMEASGFYSPRTQHEHVGEIAITVKGLTRPVMTQDEPVVDAEVVEDG